MGPLLKPAQYLEWPGFVLVAIGALIHAFFIVNNKKMMKKGLPADIITVSYCLLSGTFFLVASFLFSPPKIWSVFDGHIGIFWPFLWTCLLNIGVQYPNMWAQEYADTALIASVGAFQPFLGLLPAWLVLGESPATAGYFGLLLIVVGIYVTSLSQKIKDPTKVPAWGKTAEGNLRFTAPLASLFTNKGVRLAFLATVCGTFSVNFDKKSAMLSSFLFAPGIVYLFVGMFGLVAAKRGLWQKLERKYLAWLLLSGILYFSLNALYWYSFRYGLAIYISSLKRLHTIFLLPLSYFILKEAVMKDKKYWLGLLLFVGGLFFFTIPN